MAMLLAIHLLSAILWIGGMFLMLAAVRPAAVAVLEPPLRIRMLLAVMGRFFPWVWGALLLLLGSGYGMAFGFLGGLGNLPWSLHLMQAVAWVMAIIFCYLYFVPFARARRAVAEEALPRAAANLNRIALLVGINLTLGLLVVLAVTLGR